MAVEREEQRARAPIANGAVLAAGVDHELASVTRLDTRLDAITGVALEVAQAGEGSTLVGLDWGLRMGAEQLVARPPEVRQSVGTFDPEQVADAPPPVDEVEVSLGLSVRRRRPAVRRG